MAAAAPREGRADSPEAWRVALGSLLIIAFGMGAAYMLWSSVKTISDDMGWPRWIPSAAYAVEVLGTGIGGILMGRWVDRAGAVPVVALGTVMVPAGALLASQTVEPWQFCLVFGVMVGFLGNATLFAPLLTTATRWFDRRRGLAVAIVASGQGLAGAFWPKVFDRLIEDWGWRGTLVIYGCAGLLLMPPLLYLLRGRPPGFAEIMSRARSRRAPVAAGGAGVDNLPLMLLCAAIMCCCTAMSMPLLHIASHAQDLGYDRGDGAWLLAWLLALSFVGRLGLGGLADRIGAFRAMLMGSGLQALGLALFIPFEGLAAHYVGATLFGLGFGGLVPMYAVALRLIYPAHSIGWRVGTVFLFGALGMALGGQSAGVAFDLLGSYRPAFATGVGFNLVNLVLILTVYRGYGGLWRRAEALPPAGPAGTPGRP